MTSPGQPTGDAITAALLQITQHAERLALLDDREAQHYQQIAERLREIATQLSDMSTRVDGATGTIADQAEILASLDGLDEQVAEIADQLAEHAPPDQDDGGPAAKPYEPIPAPQWWKLEAPERDEATARLRAWVEQIYLPGYGRLAAMLAPCWDQHDLCLYILDWLAELWSVLTSPRTATPSPSPARPSGKPACCPPPPTRCSWNHQMRAHPAVAGPSLPRPRHPPKRLSVPSAIRLTAPGIRSVSWFQTWCDPHGYESVGWLHLHRGAFRTARACPWRNAR